MAHPCDASVDSEIRKVRVASITGRPWTRVEAGTSSFGAFKPWGGVRVGVAATARELGETLRLRGSGAQTSSGDDTVRNPDHTNAKNGVEHSMSNGTAKGTGIHQQNGAPKQNGTPIATGQGEISAGGSYARGLPMAAPSEGGPPLHDTLVAALKHTAATAPPTTGITYVEGSTVTFESYAELLASARRTLGALQALGLVPGDPLVMQVTERQKHIHALWGAILGGIPPVTIAIPSKYEASNAVFQKLAGVTAKLDARHVLASTVNVAPLRALLPEKVAIHDLASLDYGSAGREVVEASVTPETVVFYQLTSGSTGIPKCIPERHCAIISHIRHSIVHCNYRPSDVTMNWLPFDHVVPMLTYHLGDTYIGRSAVQVPTMAVIADPLLWMRVIEAHRVTHSWSPNFGFKLVAQAIEKSATPFAHDVSSLKLLMNAGEQCVAEVCDAFLKLTGVPRHVMQPAFGMAEVCTCMTYNNDYGPASNVHVSKESLASNRLQIVAPGPKGTTLSFMDLGPPSPGVEIRICGEDGVTALDERQVGRFQIRAPCVMGGYYNHPVANAESFVGDSWFDSGDLGFVHDGRLFLTGRAKEMIIIRGANYYCYEIEDAVMQLPGTVPARVAVTSVYNEAIGTEELLVFFVPAESVCAEAATVQLHEGGTIDRRLAELIAAVKKHITVAFSLTPKHVVPVADGAFHRTTSGKIQRGQFKKDYVEGKHAVAIENIAKPRVAQTELFEVCWTPAHDVLPDSPAPAQRSLLVNFGGPLLGASPHGCDKETTAGEALPLLATPPAWELVALMLCNAPSLEPDAEAMAILFDLTTAAMASRAPPALVCVTAGAQHPASLTRRVGPPSSSVAYAGSWGFAAVVMMERPSFHVTSLDVDPRELTAANVSRAAAAAEQQLLMRGQADAFAPRLQRAALGLSIRRREEPLKEGSYVLVGGLGGLGLHVAPWLLERGATKLLLVSRSGKVSRDGQGLQVQLEALPAEATTVRSADASQSTDIRAVIGSAPCPIAGQLYLPHIEGGELIASTTAMRFAAGFCAKASGAYLMYGHLSTRLALCLSFFASSVASFGGTRSASYSSANAYLDALVRSSAASGALARAANFPVVLGAGTGAASFRTQLTSAKSPLATIAIQLDDVVRVIGLQLSHSGAYVPLPDDDTRITRGLEGVWLPKAAAPNTGLLGDMQPKRKADEESGATRGGDAAAAAAKLLCVSDCKVLDLLIGLTGASRDDIDLDTPFMDAGVDSVMTAEFVGGLSKLVEAELEPTLVFEYSTTRAIVQHLYSSGVVPIPLQAAAAEQELLLDGPSHEFPAQSTIGSRLDSLLRSSGDAVGNVPAERWTHEDILVQNGSDRVPPGASYGSFVARADLFDAKAFGIPPAEATAMDPQQRLLLQVSYASLHKAAYHRASLAGSDLGIYLAVERPDWPFTTANVPASHLSIYAVTADTISIAGGRLSYVLGLHGPCYSLDTACSSSITATHSAALALRAAECSAAVVESVSLKLRVRSNLIFGAAGMLSADGRCKTLDESANGFARGEGCGAFVLRAPKEDASSHKLLRGSAIRQDGRSASLTAPSASAQRILLRASVANAGREAHDVVRVELHGTGTALGDPTEAAGLSGDLGKEFPLSLSAAKSNFGHMEPTAGMLGLLKSLHDLEACNGGAGLAKLSVLNPLVLTAIRRAPGASATMLAMHGFQDGSLPGDDAHGLVGISSFGYSGTIGHANLNDSAMRSDGRSLAHQPTQRSAIAFRRLKWGSCTTSERSGPPGSKAHEAATEASAVSKAISLEEVLEVTAQVVSSSDLDADVPFFDAGLDSLGATDLVSMLKGRVGEFNAPATLVFDAPTPRLVASMLEKLCSERGDDGNQPAKAAADLPQADAGWVVTCRDQFLLSDAFFHEMWYSFAMTLESAEAMYETSASLRSQFVKDASSGRWRWKIGSRARLPVFDARYDTAIDFPFADRATPVFYENSEGKLWLNHTCWDAYSMIAILRLGKPSRHFSVTHAQVSSLDAGWEDGAAVVDEIVRAPTMFDKTFPFAAQSKLVDLPIDIINMVQRYSIRARVSLDVAWQCFAIVAALECKGLSSAPFSIQAGNRNPDNADVVGYVTTEVSLIVEVDPSAALEHRLATVVRTINGLPAAHLSCFIERAMAHPEFDAFLAGTLNINVLGSEGYDDTDRTLIDEWKTAKAAAGSSDGQAEWGWASMHWIEIGGISNPVMNITGRADVIDFVTSALLPCLRAMADESHGGAVRVAEHEATLTVQQRLELGGTALMELDNALQSASFVPVPSQLDFCVVGAGMAGLTIASHLKREAEEFLVIEKTQSAGGQWRHNANFLSRVNSSEPSYRLDSYKAQRDRDTNHTHFYEIIRNIKNLVVELDVAKFRLHTEVRSVYRPSQKDEQHWMVCGNQHYKEANRAFSCRAKVAMLCTNRRLGTARELRVRGEELFLGTIARGLCGDSDAIMCTGSKVIILGMGAFAIEMNRTSFERQASDTTILCRQRGSVSPQLLDWLRFIRPFDSKTMRTDAAGDSIILTKWQGLYDDTGAARPECWLQGLLKPDGHTVSISDLFFISHALGMHRTRMGEVDHLTNNCLVTQDGEELACDTVYKCVGFTINEGNERVIGRSHTHLDPGLWLITEPHLDNTMFQHLIITSGHMNLSLLFATLMLRYHRNPSITTWLKTSNPRYRVNQFTSSNQFSMLTTAGEHDPGTRAEILASLTNLATSFCKTMSPDAYFANNQTLWEQLHDMLIPHRRLKTEPVHIAFPFKTLLSELPDMHPTANRAKTSVARAFGRRGAIHAMLDVESSLRGLTNPSVDCLTFFEGVPPTAVLQERLTLMAKANPWIAGRLRSGEGGAVHYWIPEEPDLSLDEFAMTGLTPNAPVAELMARTARHGVKLGLEAIDRDEPLFRVCLLRTGSDSFALFASLCHTLGDAATFYKLFAMLDPAKGPPKSLDFTRVQSFTAASLRISYGPEAASGHTPLPSSCNKGVAEQLKMYYAMTRVAARHKDASLATVDNAWIAQRKAALVDQCAAAGVSFLSTNDLLSSWFLSHTGASHGTVAIDCRGRSPGLSGAEGFRPGNYISSVPCLPDAFCDPLRLRQKVAATLKRAEQAPSICSETPAEMAMPKIGNVTNWSSLYEHVLLPGCRTVVHIPVIDSTKDVTHSNLYVFRPRPGELAGLSFAKAGVDISGSDTDKPFKPWSV